MRRASAGASPELAGGFAWSLAERVGEGATAVVYRAVRSGGDHAEAALKVAKPGALESWLGREATLLAGLDRRWGPTLLDAGRMPAGVALPRGAGDAGEREGGARAREGGARAREGAWFVATAWAAGRPLSEVLVELGEAHGGAARDRAPRDRAELAAVVAHGVGRALDELHLLGVRHGDVKPANVLVAPERPRRDRAAERGATLIDVGLAASITGGAATGGTPRYLAPELRRGEAATPAADLFALGLLLAEILSPEIAAAADPSSGPAVARATLATLLRGSRAADPDLAPVARLAVSLLAESAGARPSAAWVADRAARLLDLAVDAEERVRARRARVRRAYLAARRDDIAPGATLSPAIDGPPREWLHEAIALATRIGEAPGFAPPEPAGAPSSPRDPVEPLDSLGLARWLVALAGPQAATWPSPQGSEGRVAGRLLSLASRAEPEAWTLHEVIEADADAEAEAEVDADADADADPSTRWLSLTHVLLSARPRAASLTIAEDAVARGEAPAAVALDLASALLRRGEIGRAFAAASSLHEPAAAALLLRGEIARRRGEPLEADELAVRAIAAAGRDRTVADDARALRARLAWDAGAPDRAESLIDGVRGSMAAEVRGLVAYSRGEHERGLRAITGAETEAEGPLALARLAATRGMLEHARGRATASLEAFTAAADLATRAGAVIEEATYATGLAAAAVDAGAVERALAASTRAALLWERLARPALAARALLGRAAAYALVGASHEADVAARLALARATDAGDARAAAFARWAIVETRAPGDPRAREEALAADDALSASGADEDRIRSAARLLLWADGAHANGSEVDVAAIDARVGGASSATRWEWWGARAWPREARESGEARAARDATARASSRDGAPRVLAEIVALLDVPAPIGSRGPALAAGVRLAAEIGDGDVARRLETARRADADTLRAGCPAPHRAALAEVAWVRSPRSDGGPFAPGAPGASSRGGSLGALGAAQVEQLDAIVRALGSRDRLKPLLEQVLDTMVLWTGVERGLLLLRAPDGRLSPRAARNLARRDLRGEQLALSMGLARQAMDERQAIRATDAYAQIGDLHASVHALRLRSVLAVPLVARGDVLGVVYLDDRVRRGAFGDDELAWVRLVASQAALAIADARDQALLRRAVRRAERANARLAADLGAREAELDAMRAGLTQGEETRYRYDEISGRSEPMRALLRLVDRVTASDVPVLLTGESGTGKELVARAIHANGARGRRPFVGENCASVPETLLESTLFGHVRGAFTGASSTRAGLFDVADGGTLFLDEIGEMPLSMQAKLLRVLQSGEVRPVGSEREHTVDVRIIGATHRDLAAMVADGTFREDLFYRLDVVGIRVPPLRERAADIPLLVARFVDKHAQDRKVKVTRAAMDRLVAFPWPGNVRQLENEVRRAIVLADDRIDVSELSEEVARGGPGTARDAGLGLKARVDALEAQLVKDALVLTKGNQTRAAETLGISRFGLQKMMRRLGIRAS